MQLHSLLGTPLCNGRLAVSITDVVISKRLLRRPEIGTNCQEHEKVTPPQSEAYQLLRGDVLADLQRTINSSARAVNQAQWQSEPLRESESSRQTMEVVIYRNRLLSPRSNGARLLAWQ